MLLEQIIKSINKLVSNNSSSPLRYERDLKFYLDSAIDFINTELNTDFPIIDDAYDGEEQLTPQTFDYQGFGANSDRYTRQILIYYTASLYLEEEDETEQQYQVYRTRAVEALAKWKRTSFGCYDMVDNQYDYEVLSPFQDYLNNTDKFDEQKSKLTEEYISRIESTNPELAAYYRTLLEEQKNV